MTRYKTILLIDDHGMVREGAALYLRLVNPDLEILHARSPTEGLQQVRDHHPDLVFLDLRFEDDPEAGKELLKSLKAGDEFDDIPVVVMTGERLDRKGVEELIGMGAAGYLAKGTADSAEIFKLALMNMEAGGVFIHGARAGAAGAGAARTPTVRSGAQLGLRPSHYRVLARHVRGMPYKRIAHELDITEATVKEYVSDMCRDFKVENAKELIYEVARAGMAFEDDAIVKSSKGDGRGR
jgi:DNA-binding NarL/FixJ family response regulator